MLTETASLAALLTTAEMYRADAAAAASGVSSLQLMEAAGTAVALEVVRRWSKGPVAVLCGPGNNGGDGFVAARILKSRGWPVRLGLLGGAESLRGDAGTNAGRWSGAIEPLGPDLLDGAVGVVDALFGAGLKRPLDGDAAAVIEAVNARRLPCIAVDMPSGARGDDGTVEGPAPRCVATVTFFRPKPGHLLYPARALAGHLVVADIGIPDRVLADIGPCHFINGPALWRLPVPAWHDHKYARGHVVVLGGAQLTGAGRLAVRGARRMGAGLVTVAAPRQSIPIYAGDAPGTLMAPLETEDDFGLLLEDSRKNTYVMGPGGGSGELLCRRLREVLAAGRHCVIDADAITSFAPDPRGLFRAIGGCGGEVVLTPHEGEYARLFDHPGTRLEKARSAAAESGGTIVLKGPDTIIAAPDGRTAITPNGTPDLATAGTGDVLAGMIAGLMAQGMAGFAAACAATWMHAEAARRFGPGLIAEDIPDALPGLIAELRLPPPETP